MQWMMFKEFFSLWSEKVKLKFFDLDFNTVTVMNTHTQYVICMLGESTK